MSDHDDPTRSFLDQTVPRQDEDWLGQEPEEGPARPRHVQHPVAPEPPVDPKVRRKETIKRAAWTFGPSLGYLAVASSLSGDSAEAPEREPRPEPQPQARPEPEPEQDMSEHMDHMDMDYGGGYGEAGSGL